MVVHFEAVTVECADLLALAIPGGYRQPAENMVFQFRAARFQFTPGDPGIAVLVHAHRPLQVAQCDIPLSGQGAAVFHVDGQVTVTGFVPQRQGGKNQ